MVSVRGRVSEEGEGGFGETSVAGPASSRSLKSFQMRVRQGRGKQLWGSAGNRNPLEFSVVTVRLRLPQNLRLPLKGPSGDNRDSVSGFLHGNSWSRVPSLSFLPGGTHLLLSFPDVWGARPQIHDLVLPA